ncbi:MAG: toll/interleukin-1 receptor domain-containing protein [Solobacterium sp.]|nr:toll/interleukin-1 receptor domain-containing protein [Solobacterium sp.]
MKKSNRKIILVSVICWILLMAAGFFTLILPVHRSTEPVMMITAEAAAALCAVLLFAKMPLKRIIQGSMPLYLLLIGALLLVPAFFRLRGTYAVIGGYYIRLISLIGLIWFAGAYCVSKYEVYRMRNLLWPLILLLLVPAIACIENGSTLTMMPMGLAVILYLVRLSTDGRVDSQLKGLARTYFVLIVAALLAAPFWVPWMLRISGIESYRFDSPYAEDMLEILKSVKLLGTSPLMRFEQPAYVYYADLGYAYIGLASALYLGWIPVAAAVAAASVFCGLIRRSAYYAVNSYARHLALGTSSWFAMRVFMFCLVFYLRAPAAFTLPFTGDFLTVVCDCVLASASVCLCLRKDEAPEGLLDNKRSMTAMLDVMIDSLKDKLSYIEDRSDPVEEWDEYLSDDDDSIEYPGWLAKVLGYSVSSPEEEISALKQRIYELEQDKLALEESNITLTEVIEKYAGSMADAIVPQKYERDLIFLSHNHMDMQIAEYLAGKLEESGLKAWYYERDIIAGSYPQEIMKALKRTKIFVIVISRTSNESEEVYNEVGNAARMLKDGLVLMPLVIDELVLSDFLQHYLGRHEMIFALERPLNEKLDGFAANVLETWNQNRANDVKQKNPE